MTTLQAAHRNATVAQAESLKNALVDAQLWPRFRDYWLKIDDDTKLSDMPYSMAVVLKRQIGYTPPMPTVEPQLTAP
jgi:hypothetical protein